MREKSLLVLSSSSLELVTGLVAIAAPSSFVHLLFSAELTPGRDCRRCCLCARCTKSRVGKGLRI